MRGAIIWAALSVISFGLFLLFPSEHNGANYLVLAPAFISLAASVLLLTQYKERGTHTFASSTPISYDDRITSSMENIRHNKQEEQSRMLRTQSSKRRAVNR